MSPELLRFLGQLVLAIIGGGVVVAIINNFLSPKTKAETRSIAQKSAQETIDQALENLRTDLKRAIERADRAEEKADNADTRADEAEARVDAMAARDRILVNYLWDLMAWSKRWYEAGHPPGMMPPPKPPAELDTFGKP